MANIAFYKAGQIGIIKDIPPEELPPQAWSDGNNVRFEDGKIKRGYGVQPVFGTPLAAPYWLMPVFTPTQVFWVYANLTRLFATDGSSHADVGRVTDYGTIETNLWNGGMFSGIPVITNFINVPQYWASPSLATDFADLANWPASTFAKVIKGYKNFLVALNVRKGATDFPHLVKWSAPAAPGAIPSSWDETDPTTLAGEVEIGDALPGGIQDAIVLRDSLIIYKDNITWGMQFIGGQSVFRFYPIFSDTGILSTHCARPIRKGTMHIVATGDDIVVHDGQNIDSILDKRWKRFLRANISTTRFDRSFMAINLRNDEAWFCFPRANDWPDTALIWNWVDNTITQRDLLAETTFMDAGPVQPGGDPWNSAVGTWDTDSEIWDLLAFRVHFANLLGSNVSSVELQQHDDETVGLFDEEQFTAFVERTGLALIGQDRVSGEFKADYSSRKICTRIWIKANGSAFQVQVGAQEDAESPVVYEAAQTFTPGTDRYLDFTANGRYLAVKFFSDIAGQWEIEGYNLEIQVLGEL